MKTYKKFILENLDEVTINIIEKVKKNCQPFLKEGHIMYRGVKEDIHTIQKFEPLTDRKPKDLPFFMHQYMDELLFKKFGWRPRSEGVFTTSLPQDTEPYQGTVEYNPNIFFPVGEYKYVYNTKIRDLWSEIWVRGYDSVERWYDKYNIEQSWSDVYPEDIPTFTKEYENDVKNYLREISEGYTNDNFDDARNVEVIFKCDSYYLINKEYGNEILNLF